MIEASATQNRSSVVRRGRKTRSFDNDDSKTGMNSIVETSEHQATTMSTETIANSNRGQTTVTPPHQEQRRGSTPALMVGAGGHKKLCRVVHGQRVVLGTTPPVFVAELRPSASSEYLSSSHTPPKSRSPLNVEVDETVLSNSMVNVKLLEAQDSDPCYTSGSEHSALSRNTSEASETLSQECAYSPTLTTTTASSGSVDIFANSRSPVNSAATSTNYEFVSDFSKLTLQDSGYSGSFPLCATNSDASIGISTPTSGGMPQMPVYDGINPDYYASLLDFTLKLGYSEAQLKSVLCKLATTNPGQDKVLAELIKLGQDVQEISQPAEIGPVTGSQMGTSTVTFGSGGQQWSASSGLRAIVIDGSNVAMTHGNKVVFSCLGIRICVDWFRRRGHTDIKVFVPQFRKEQSRSDNPITDQHVLFDLEKENVLVWTPSRRLGGRRIICHDDRYILKTAVDKDAVIVSNDEYRDMINENPDFRKAVDERLLMYNFIDDKFVPPDDPLGRYGPKLDQFLSKSSPNSSAPPCPYGRKCTYGNKCKFYHPERPGGLHRSVTERLRDHAEMHRRISPTNSLQHQRLGATDSFCEYSTKNEQVGQKPMAFRTQSLNPAQLLRQRSSNSTSPGRYSPPSLTAPYLNHPLAQPVGPPMGGQRKYQQVQCDARVQRLQADGHVSLSKQMSNPEAARNSGFQAHSAFPVSDDSRYLLMPPGPAPPSSFLRQIWQNEQQQHHVVSENHLHPHQPVVRNMSAPGVNLLRHQTQLSYAPPTNNSLFIGNHYVNDHQRKNSVSDSQLNLLGVGVSLTTTIESDDAFYPLSPPFGGSNYFIPSTTVWGPVEHSSSPVFTSPGTTGWTSSTSSPPLTNVTTGNKSMVSPTSTNSLESARSKVCYHLSQLFPEELVSSVMRANPNETDPQKLCSIILSSREQRKSGDSGAAFAER